MKCCEATLVNVEVQYHCIMYFKMNVAPYGNILICILYRRPGSKFGYHDSDTILLMESSTRKF